VIHLPQLLLRYWPKVLIGLVFVLLVSGGAAGFALTQQKLSASIASQQAVRVAGPLTVTFNQEIAPGAKASIEPMVAGSWRQKGHLLGATTMEFVPSKRFQAGQRYTVRVTGLRRLATGAAIPNVEQVFRVQAPASVDSTSPAVGAKDVAIGTKFSIKLADANNGVRNLVPALSPAVPLKLMSSDDRTFVWTPATPLAQGTTYTFSVQDTYIANPADRTLVSVPFTTVAQPAIVSARTGGYFTPGQNVDIAFGQAMEPATNPITFDTPGKGAWLDERTYRFTPTDIKPGTTYHYVVKAGIRSKAGGVLEADRPFEFATTGVVSASLSPGGTGNSLNAPFRVAFDQPVDHASAEARFGVSPGVSGSFSWSGNTMTYAHADLAYQTTYSYSVAPGVVPSWGLPNTHAIGGSMATLVQVVKLNVPQYRQSYAMSCELTSLKMVLAYRGIGASEYDIVQRVGYAPRARDTVNNVWDDPNLQFVGDLNGKMDTTGYGVYSGPIAKAAISYGRNAVATSGVSPAWIAHQIQAGNPVIFWGHSTPAHADDWNGPNGVVHAYISAHARVAIGVVGPADNPTGFYVNDPMGSSTYWDTAHLIETMNVMGNISNQTVVVY
jgi:uncharacterized protein YvpB